jgi:hypothetical protein
VCIFFFSWSSYSSDGGIIHDLIYFCTHFLGGISEEFVPVIRQLCDDEGLKLFIGEGVKDLVFECVDENQTYQQVSLTNLLN